jgi:hypothetical protein
MVEQLVTAERLAAGLRYVEALAALGFRPDAALWSIGVDPNEDQRVQLSLVSSLVERVGPKKIYDLLFQAYDHAGTPANFDPWIVGLYGADTTFGEAMRHEPIFEFGAATIKSEDGQEQSIEAMEIVGNRMFYKGWIYVRRFQKRDVASELRLVEKFKKNVDRLAA